MGNTGNIIQFEKNKDGSVLFSHRLIRVKIFLDTKIEIDYMKDGKPLSYLIPAADNKTMPHYPVVNGEAVTDFTLAQVDHRTVEDEFGRGESLSVKASSSCKIEKELIISLYEKYPDSVMMQCRYTNTGSDVVLEEAVSLAFELDRKRISDRYVSPTTFWNFSGIGKQSTEPDQGYINWNLFPVSRETVPNSTEEFCGIPFTDFWAEEMGIAFSSIEKKARILSMPISTSEDRAHFSIRQKPACTLKKDETFSAFHTMVTVHSGDYYKPLRRYSEVLADIGIQPKPAPDFGYEPLWCNWGYEWDWKLEHGMDRIDLLKKLGVTQITVDDGWFVENGDWTVSPEKFPGGEEELISYIRKFKEAGMKVILWWVPGIAGKKQVAEHPEWLILDRDGKPALDRQWHVPMFCPTIPAVQDYFKELTRKFIQDYDVDGFKMDGTYFAPLCYNKGHNHESPEASYMDYEEFFKGIYETAAEIKGEEFVLEICPCGELNTPQMTQWTNRPITADPPEVWNYPPRAHNFTSRYRLKAYKALLGPTACISNDMHESFNEFFPAEIGCGGVLFTKFTDQVEKKERLSDAPDDRIDEADKKEYEKWFGLYNKYQLSSGNFRGELYDIMCDTPETYAIEKNGCMFYTFIGTLYANDRGVTPPEVKQEVELRGLSDKEYAVYNIETDAHLFDVQGPVAKVNLDFKGYLLLKAEPK